MKNPRVYFVTQELPAFFQNGGGGTATLGFAETLAGAGVEIGILYVAALDTSEPVIVDAVSHMRQQGLKVHFLSDDPTIDSWNDSPARRSYAVYCWLKRNVECGIVHFNDFDGLGFYASQAKRCGAALENIHINIVVHGSFRWASQISDVFFTSERFEIDHMERRTVEYADSVMIPSKYIGEWLVKSGVRIPDNTVIQRIILPGQAGNHLEYSGNFGRASEIIFFGRHEIRKGFAIFVAAVAKLAKKYPDITFKFLGKAGEIHGLQSQAYAMTKLHEFVDRISFVTPRTAEDLKHLLTREGVLAVIPSIDENFPSTVHECIKWGVDFIASNVGGIPEIMNQTSREGRLFNPTLDDLFGKICECVETGGRVAAHLGFDPREVAKHFIEWNQSAFESIKSVVAHLDGPDPLVSIVLVHYDRPNYLAQAFDSLLHQNYKNLEIILVDDGSPSELAQRYISKLESDSSRLNLKLVRSPDVGLGAARNRGLRECSGRYVIFMDDDNVAFPEMTTRLVHAIRSSGSDAVVCFANNFFGHNSPIKADRKGPEYFPLGDAINAGLFGNAFGDAHAIWKMQSLIRLDGFSETRLPSEDWELYARASLEGASISVLPEQVYWYRQHSGSLSVANQSRWKLFTQISDLYGRYVLADRRIILQALQFHSVDRLRQPESSKNLSDEAKIALTRLGLNSVLRKRDATAGSKSLALVQNFTEGDMRVLSDTGSFDVDFAKGWADVLVEFDNPLSLDDITLRALVFNDSEKSISLRFCFVCSALDKIEDKADAKHELDLWRDYPPGISFVSFSTADCLVRGDPDTKNIEKIYFGGSPGNAQVRFNLSADRGSCFSDIFPIQTVPVLSQ